MTDQSLRSESGPYFGTYGGRFVPESLIAALDQLEATYLQAKADPSFQGELAELHRTYTGRPSIITEVKRFAEHAGPVRIFLKREDLNHTGSHKINNVLGQALLTKRMGKTRIIAETGAGQHLGHHHHHLGGADVQADDQILVLFCHVVPRFDS